MVDWEASFVIFAHCTFGEMLEESINNSLRGGLETGIVKGQTSFVILALGTLGVSEEESFNDVFLSTVETCTVDGKPSILIATLRAFTVGCQEGFNHLNSWRKHTCLVKGQETKVSIESLGNNPSRCFVCKGIGTCSGRTPILFENQTEKDSAVFVIDLVITIDNSTAAGRDGLIANLAFRLEFLHGNNDGFLILRSRTFNKVEGETTLAVPDADSFGKGIQ
mmetsp:Transcript_26502/g.37219  ORF Transcript_26502/g.37219 Transcript_26502/m.37219 type:complete len:222 (-) Transcript_26502:648-1313(-)